MRYKRKVAIVTGAGSGIGRGIAEFLAEEGAFVLLNDVRHEGAEGSMQILTDKGYRSEIAISDISTPDGAAIAINEAVRCGGRPDLVVKCPGRPIINSLEDLEPAGGGIALAL